MLSYRLSFLSGSSLTTLPIVSMSYGFLMYAPAPRFKVFHSSNSPEYLHTLDLPCFLVRINVILPIENIISE